MTVLSSPERAGALRELLLRETTTIGLRWRTESKMALAREFAEVETEWGKVRMKAWRRSPCLSCWRKSSAQSRAWLRTARVLEIR